MRGPWTGRTSDLKARSELRGKTLLLVGLGGSGTQIARRAHAFGMRVRALDERAVDRPDFRSEGAERAARQDAVAGRAGRQRHADRPPGPRLRHAGAGAR